MKRNVVILTIALILTALLGAASISLAAGTWKKKADIPTARCQAAGAVVNNLVYVFGGWDGRKALATLEVYNPSVDKWEKKADMPTIRRQQIAAAVDGKIYLIGGASQKERRGRNLDFTLRTVEVYDPIADAWEQKADMPTPRNSMGGAVLDGKIYTMSGDFATSGNASKFFEIYDPATDTWAKGPETIERRFCTTAAAVNGKIYLMTGFKRNGIYIQMVEEYDPATDKWVQKQDIGFGRHHVSPSSAVAGGKIYVTGGHDGANIVAQVEEYDPAADQWVKITKMPTARSYIVDVTVRGKIYTIAGSGIDAVNEVGAVEAPSDAVATVEEYTPPGWPFAVSPQGKLATTWGTLKTTY